MAAKKSSKGQSSDPPVEEFDANVEQPSEAGDVIEYDPEAAEAVGELEIQEAESAADTSVPEEGFLKARDELEAVLGGFEVVAVAATAAAQPGALGIDNIRGVGVGIRSVGDSYTDELAVKVYVAEKAPLSRLDSAFAIPPQVNGYPTDVEPIGEVTALTYKARYPRPVPCGVSCGHIRITAGTIGCLAVLNNNRLCILSNNHVLANENNARQGDPIVQPGPIDGGRMPADCIGVLERFVPINFPGPNLVDAAAAWTSFRLVKPQHVTYRMNPKPLAPSLLRWVMKNGRTTQRTMGYITGVHVNSLRVRYGTGIALFNDQIIIRKAFGSFSGPGDSGSVIVSTRTRQPIGLLFAGGPDHTVANPAAAVASQLGIIRVVGG
jgi:hypothetical protein